MPNEIRVYPELCCGCMLCSVTCSALHQKAFCPSAAYISVRGDAHDAHFSITIEQGCDMCLACVKICPTGALQRGESDG